MLIVNIKKQSFRLLVPDFNFVLIVKLRIGKLTVNESVILPILFVFALTRII